jgi:hypothetical protein
MEKKTMKYSANENANNQTTNIKKKNQKHRLPDCKTIKKIFWKKLNKHV